MYKEKTGDRVGAILSSSPEGVKLIGYGVYLGDEPCPLIGGAMNPKVRLDNGKIIWGCQMWWGSEKEISEHYKDVKIVPLTEEEEKQLYVTEEEE